MSYCHLNCGGLPDIDLVFGDVVSAEIRSTVATASCLTPVGDCGNGVVDPGEQCDDGNLVAGDGCSASCRLEVCGNGILGPGEQCDDGNLVSGNGCSAGCRLEPCKIMRSGQTLWLRSLLSAQHGASESDRLSLRAEFAIPSAFGTLDPAATGMSLLVEDGAGGYKLALTLPPGAHWIARRGRWLYRDRAGSVGGIRRLQIANDSPGGGPRGKVSVTGRNGSHPLPLADLP